MGNRIVNYSGTKPMVDISISKIQSQDLKELLKFALYTDKQAFIEEFRKANVIFIDNPDEYDKQLDFLAYLGNTGADKCGKLRMPDGTPVFFSTLGILSRVNISHDSLNAAKIKIVK